MERIVDAVCTLCREHEKAGFVEGVKVGIQLKMRFWGGLSAGCDEPGVGLSMMRYTEGKASSACFGERQLRGLIGKLLY